MHRPTERRHVQVRAFPPGAAWTADEQGDLQHHGLQGHGCGDKGCTPPFRPHEPKRFHEESPCNAHLRHVAVEFSIDPCPESMESEEDGQSTRRRLPPAQEHQQDACRQGGLEQEGPHADAQGFVVVVVPTDVVVALRVAVLADAVDPWMAVADHQQNDAPRGTEAENGQRLRAKAALSALRVRPRRPKRAGDGQDKPRKQANMGR